MCICSFRLYGLDIPQSYMLCCVRMNWNLIDWGNLPGGFFCVCIIIDVWGIHPTTKLKVVEPSHTLLPLCCEDEYEGEMSPKCVWESGVKFLWVWSLDERRVDLVSFLQRLNSQRASWRILVPTRTESKLVLAPPDSALVLHLMCLVCSSE